MSRKNVKISSRKLQKNDYDKDGSRNCNYQECEYKCSGGENISEINDRPHLNMVLWEEIYKLLKIK